MFILLRVFIAVFVAGVQIILLALQNCILNIIYPQPSGRIQCFHILWKYKLELKNPSHLNFITVHDAYVDPSYILSDNVTLYCINKSWATFVESPKNVNVYDSSVHPFFYNAQFNTAVKVIHMPLEVAEKLISETPDMMGSKTAAKIVHLSSTGRCGSTYFCQILEKASPRIIVLSEPDAFLDCISITKEKDISKRILRITYALQCKPHLDTELFVLKTRSVCSALIEPTAEQCSHVKQVFMYRDFESVVKSAHRLVSQAPSIVYKSPTVRKYGPLSSMQFKGLDPNKTVSSLLFATWICMSSVSDFVEARHKGIDVASLRYEDLLADRYSTCKSFLQFSGFSDPDIELKPDSEFKDSQAGTVFARDKLKDASEGYTGRNKVEIDALCDKLGVPRLSEKNVILDGTLSPTTI